MRGTTEYSPPRWMLARKRSFVSWSVRVLDDVLVPQAGQDRRDGRLADLAAVPLAVAADQRRRTILMPLDLDDLEQLLARVGEVLAQVVGDLLARRLELRP